MKKYIIALLLLCSVLGLSACNKEVRQAKSDTLTVYTTVYPLSYFTERIAGNKVDVHSIYPPGANEHTFEPTQKDMMKLADADIFFYIGLGLEGFVENAKKTLDKEDVSLVATADRVTDAKLATSTGHVHAEDEEHEHDEHEHDHAHGEIDSHVWLSPSISEDLAASILHTLSEKMPAEKENFTKNYDALIQDLQKLDKDYAQGLKDVTQHTFFVSHAAFGYIAGNYGLNQVPIAGLNSQSEPSQKALMKLVEQAKKDNISTIFFEQNVSSKLTEVIQKEVGATSSTLHNLSVLTNEDIKQKEDYFSLMYRNLEALQKALQ